MVVGAQGFQEQRSEVFIERGKPMTVRLTLLKPQPKATQAGTAYLSVDSAPSGARIFLDGKEMPKLTPANFSALTIGKHEVVLQKELYLPARAAVTLDAERPGSVTG